MNFINSSLTSIVVKTHLNSFRDIAWMATPRISHGSSLDQHQRQDQVELQVFADRDGFHKLIADSRHYVSDFAYRDGPENPHPTFRNTTSVVITHHPDHRFVDWQAVTNPYLSQLHDAGSQAVERNADAMIFATAMVTALATGLAAIGPVGALPAGMVAGFGYLILTLAESRQVQPEGPASASQVQFITAKVVEEQLDIQDAQKAATAFTTTCTDLRNKVADIYDHLVDASGVPNGRDLAPEQLEGFKRFIAHELLNSGEGTLKYSINHLQDHPEIAKWIIPAYFAGIGAYLSILRIDTILNNATFANGVAKYSITTADVQHFSNEVTRLKSGGQNAIDAFHQLRDRRIADVHLDGTTVAQQLGDLIARSMFGIADQAKLPPALQAITDMETELAKDLKAGSFTHFLGFAVATP